MLIMPKSIATMSFSDIAYQANDSHLQKSG